MNSDNLQRLTPTTILDKFQINDETYMLFVSNGDTLPVELTPEQKYEAALKTPCPIQKFAGKTLGDVLTLEPGALKWIANKFTSDPKIQEAAKFICEYAVEKASA